MNEGKIPYSYHTFMLPFIWQTDMDSQESLNDIGNTITGNSENQAETRPRWERVYSVNSPVKEELLECNKEECSDPQQKSVLGQLHELYQAKQYFTESARQLLYDEKYNTKDKEKNKGTKPIDAEDAVAMHFGLVKGTKSEGKYKYIIKKTEDEEQDKRKEYILDIDQVYLSLYNSGVGILRLDLEYIPDDHTIATYQDFNKVNEYGRRVRLPFIPDKKEYSLTADSICIETETDHIEENFFEYNYQADHVMEPLEWLLPENFTFKKSQAAAQGGGHKIYLKSIVDDRMYTCSMLNDWTFPKRNISITDPAVYETGFIETGCSCPDDAMREDIMKRCGYRRWLPYGTLDVVTHHSYIRITGSQNFKDIEASVIRPFLIEYRQMAQMALVQRATVLAMTDKIADVADNPETKKVKQIDTLHQQWVKALSQIMLSEVTVQEQGVEEFHMMRNELLVPEGIEQIDHKLDLLHRQSMEIHEKEEKERSDELEKHDRELNQWVALLTVVQVIGVIWGLLDVMISVCSKCDIIRIAAAWIVFIIIILIFLWNQCEKKKHIK